MQTGLEGIAFDIPQSYLDLNDLARAREVDPQKYLNGLGQREMAVASACEDTVALAAEAGARLLENFEIDPDSIGLVITGTETPVDQSKPVAIYVHQLLGLPEACRTFEVKHACYGAMAGVQMASDWIRAGRARGKKALVIASDIARYGARTPGEPTQGAGAVAMLVSDRPRLLEFESESQGVFSRQVMDFWRPNYSKEALADGHYSIQCYLDALSGAYRMYREERGHSNERELACLYHAPFVKMARKAHLRYLEVERGAPFAEGSPELAAAQKDFAERVAPHLELNARVGNLYTGSLFLSLFSLLEGRKVGDAGKRISLFSYGSGCTAEWMSARVSDGANHWMNRRPAASVLAARTRLTVAEYEEMLEAAGRADAEGAAVCDPARWKIERRMLYLGNHGHQRRYSVNGKTVA